MSVLGVGGIIIAIVIAIAQGNTKWNTLDWLEAHNVTYELHNVTTVDGYQLQVQRLPRLGARPVLLVHGLLGSSLSWVCLGPGKSLAFQLYHQHYDVWLANLRGSSPYGRHHLELTDVMAEFWNYSFHEFGSYDLAAIIDHMSEITSRTSIPTTTTTTTTTTTLDASGEEEEEEEEERDAAVASGALLEPRQVLLIGHSQAFNAFLVLCSMHPRFNHRILLMQALAPLARLHHQVRFDATQVRAVMKFVKKRKNSNKFEMFSTGQLRKICQKKREQCEYYTKQLLGSSQNNKKLLDFAFNYDNLLQGGSIREIKHLQQIWQSGDFISYDFGPIENLQIYHNIEALNYNLSAVSVPIILYFGQTDALATPEGVHGIYARMLNTVRSVRRIASNKFNHLDFILSSDVKTLVNDKLIELMEKFLEGKLPYIIE